MELKADIFVGCLVFSTDGNARTPTPAHVDSRMNYGRKYPKRRRRRRRWAP